jgi:protein TonB
MMRNSAAITQGGWMPRFAARSTAICVALVVHIAALVTLAYDPIGKLVADEPPGPIYVEIVVASRSATAESPQAAVVEPTPTAAAELPLPTVADERPPKTAEREKAIAIEDSATVPTPRPKPAVGAPHVQLAKSSVPPPTSVQIMKSSGVSDVPESGSTRTSDTNKEPVDVPSTWKARLLSHIDRYKRYPSAARAKGTEGTALLSFDMDRDGRVLGYHLVHSSGCPELDDEAFAMIARASPLPPAPPKINTQVVQLVVPIRFRM